MTKHLILSNFFFGRLFKTYPGAPWVGSGVTPAESGRKPSDLTRKRRYLDLLQHVLELHQELLGIFSFVGDAVEGLGELALQRQTERD